MNFRHNKQLVKNKRFGRRRKIRSVTLYYFQTCTISRRNMILALIIINGNIKIIIIIGKVMGGSCIGMLVILIRWKLSGDHGLRLLILIGDIKTMITFMGNMILFKTYLTDNISGLRDISIGELSTSSSTTIRNTATSVHNMR